MEKYYLWLIQVFGVANPHIHVVLKHFGTAENAYNQMSNGDNSFLSKAETSKLKTASLDISERIISDCKNKGIDIVTIANPVYPDRLKNIYNPPAVIFVKGKLEGIDDEICITGVGTRNPSEYSAKLCHKICTDLSKMGVVLVSGMAYGLDKIVHDSAVNLHNKTVGVLACGFDIDYPKGSKDFRQRIVLDGGAIITEHLPSTNVNGGYFNARNRILSGLSLGTMVFQAANGSGALITANYAVQQGRDLFCVTPHDLFDPQYAGVIEYLRDGAIPLFNHLDVVNAYFSRFSEQSIMLSKEKYDIKPDKPFVFEKKQIIEKKTKEVEKPIEQKEEAKSIDTSNMTFEYKVIAELLSDGQKQIDVLIRNSGFNAGKINEILIDMELDGIVECLAGSNYRLI